VGGINRLVRYLGHGSRRWRSQYLLTVRIHLHACGRRRSTGEWAWPGVTSRVEITTRDDARMSSMTECLRRHRQRRPTSLWRHRVVMKCHPYQNRSGRA